MFRPRLGAFLVVSVMAAHAWAAPWQWRAVDPTGAAAGEAKPQPAPPEPARAEPTAAEVAGAPGPGFESGRADGEVEDSDFRRIGRAALFVPRVVVNVVLTPLRGLVWVNERYHLSELYRRIFFNKDLTIGLYPTARFETMFGVSVGARFVDRDLFGEREHLGLEATFGGVFREAVSGSITTGDRLGSHFGLGLFGDWERRPHDPFYGIGNGDEVGSAPMPIDPLVNPTAVYTSYQRQLARAALSADLRPIDSLHLLATSAISELQVGTGNSGPAIEEVYVPSDLIGFGKVHHAYEELEVRIDRRRRATIWEPTAVYADGWLAASFLGHVNQLNGGYDFWRAGVELQYFLRLATGPRVLAARFHGEGVSGSRDVVPFYELAELGGGSFLRGYPYERFRDRIAAVGSLEYQWDLGHFVDASVFVDAGRVLPSLTQLGVEHLRVGYGVAVHLHTDAGFLAEASIASSIDGGVFLSLSFDRVYDAAVVWR